MNAAAIIIRRLVVIVAHYTDAGCEYTLYHVVRHKRRIRIQKKVRDFKPDLLSEMKRPEPGVLIITGKGVISKTYPPESEAVQNIVSRTDEFVSASETQSDGSCRIAFMRKEQYDKLNKRLSGFKLHIVDTRFADEGDEVPEILNAGADFFTGTLSMKNLLKPSDTGSSVLSIICSRLMLPALSAALLVMGASFFVQHTVQKRIAEQVYALAVLQKSANVNERRQSEEKQLHGMLLQPATHRYSLIADRIASVVPDGVMLTGVTFNPFLKKLQKGNPIVTDRNKVLVSGESPASTAVAQFVESLELLEIVATVRLLSLKRDKNNVYLFEIEAGI